VFIPASNESGEVRNLPVARNFAIVAGNQQYDWTGETRPGGGYDGGRVQPGIERDRFAVFEVPEDTTQDELDVVWTTQFSDGAMSTVYWDGARKV
jgi:hypothetical protein